MSSATTGIVSVVITILYFVRCVNCYNDTAARRHFTLSNSRTWRNSLPCPAPAALSTLNRGTLASCRHNAAHAELCATNRLMIRRVTRSSAVAERAPCIRVRVWGPDQIRTRIRTVQDCYPDSAPAPVGRPSWTGLPWEKIWSPASRKIWHTCVNCGCTHECQIWP